MERLTNRDYIYNGNVTFTRCSITNCVDKCSDCVVLKDALFRLKEYEDLEEDGKLVRL